VSPAEAEVAREEAEHSRALAEEGRELAEEVRRSAESLRLERGGAEGAARQTRQIIESALRAEAWFQQHFEVLVEGVNEMRTTLTQLRQEAAALRQLLSDTQQALREEQIIAAERRATQQRMDRERFGDMG
jgi:hypothetical protein